MKRCHLGIGVKFKEVDVENWKVSILWSFFTQAKHEKVSIVWEDFFCESETKYIISEC